MPSIRPSLELVFCSSQSKMGPNLLFFYSFYPSQSKIGPSLFYPFILSIRTSPRWVSVNYILLFISSVQVQVWSQFIIFFILVLHSSPSFVPVYDIILFLHLSQSKVGPSLSYPLSYLFVPVQDWL